MPDIGTFHPIIVHFVVALLFVGVAMRVVSLTGKLSFTKSAATVLILLGTVATILAARSGDDAHGPAERIPGARDAVHEHEEAGRHEEAARLIKELARRRPDEIDVQLLMVESLIEDRSDGRAALAALEKLSVPPDNRRGRLQYGLHTAAAWELIGETDSARVALGQLQTDFPNSTAIQERLDRLDTPPQ